MNLTNENYLLFCAHNYDNAHYASTEDFIKDLNRIKYIKKLITRYIESGDLKYRLILNHIIILNNCFGPEALNQIMILKLRKYMKYIKPFLIFLNILTEKIYNVNNEIIDMNMFEMDQNIVNKLRALQNEK